MDGDYQPQANFQGNFRLKDVEEKQNILKDRLLLIGQNLVDFKEETSLRILELKKDVEKMKDDVEKIKTFLDLVSSEMGKFARKDDLEILKKQARMFQPLEFAKKHKEEN
ncbi:hypothetical protein HYT25_03890 [Candidatus Pacearchaeota archaeon]|nr:hypothetical protein [Candidatus Pacearchaeota archaeon]